MNAIAVLVVCFALAYGQLHYVDDSELFEYSSMSGYEEDKVLSKLHDILKEAGTLRIYVEKYVIQPDEALNRYAKTLIMEGHSAALIGMSLSDVDEVLSESQSSLGPITIFNIGSELSGDDLLSESSDWHLVTAQKSQKLFDDNDDHIYVEEFKPLLVSKTDGFVCELIIGPSLSKIQEVNLQYFNGLNHQQNGHFILSSPYLDIGRLDGTHSIRYGLFMHDTEINGQSIFTSDINQQKKFAKVIQLIRGITLQLEEDIQNMEPEHNLEVDYTYSANAEMISLSDDNALDYARHWVHLVDDRRIRIDLYGMIRQYINDPLSLRIYRNPSDISHDHHEFDAEIDNAVLFMDRAPERDDIFYRMNTNRLNKRSLPMHSFLDNTLNQILYRVGNQGLDERNLNTLHKWIMSLIKRDFQKYRYDSGVQYKFYPSDQHFSGTSMTRYRPNAYRSNAQPQPVYSIHKKVYCDKPRSYMLGRPICSY